MATAKRRADVLVVEQGLADTRARAQALIMAGEVVDRTAARAVNKAGDRLPPESVLALRRGPLPFVSRAGGKLAPALTHFGIDPAGRDCLDVGASTGGFTDCLLQRGATRVVALDVGHDQLAWALRQDPRVVVRERCNVRTAADDAVPFAVSLATVDVSFISLKLVLPAMLRWLSPGAELVALVKPQFEVGRGDVGKGGIVTCAAARARALDEVVACAQALGLAPLGTLASPVLGTKGNQEYLLAARYQGKA